MNRRVEGGNITSIHNRNNTDSNHQSLATIHDELLEQVTMASFEPVDPGYWQPTQNFSNIRQAQELLPVSNEILPQCHTNQRPFHMDNKTIDDPDVGEDPEVAYFATRGARPDVYFRYPKLESCPKINNKREDSIVEPPVVKKRQKLLSWPSAAEYIQVFNTGKYGGIAVPVYDSQPTVIYEDPYPMMYFLRCKGLSGQGSFGFPKTYKRKTYLWKKSGVSKIKGKRWRNEFPRDDPLVRYTTHHSKVPVSDKSGEQRKSFKMHAVVRLKRDAHGNLIEDENGVYVAEDSLVLVDLRMCQDSTNSCETTEAISKRFLSNLPHATSFKPDQLPPCSAFIPHETQTLTHTDSQLALAQTTISRPVNFSGIDDVDRDFACGIRVRKPTTVFTTLPISMPQDPLVQPGRVSPYSSLRYNQLQQSRNCTNMLYTDQEPSRRLTITPSPMESYPAPQQSPRNYDSNRSASYNRLKTDPLGSCSYFENMKRQLPIISPLFLPTDDDYSVDPSRRWDIK